MARRGPDARPDTRACRTTPPGRRSATRSAAASSARASSGSAGPGRPARVRRAPRRPPGGSRPGPRSCRPSCAASSATTCARTSVPRGGRAALAGADPGAGPRRALRVAGPAGLGGGATRPGRGLHRDEGSAWTVADAPLLDELAELLGPTARRPGARGARARGAPGLRRGGAGHPGVGRPADRRGGPRRDAADRLRHRRRARRPAGAGRTSSVAERAAADRDWRFGHLVVDEAQELSADGLARPRCGAAPTHSITAVGDLAHAAPRGRAAWADVLAPQRGSRWTYRRSR